MKKIFYFLTPLVVSGLLASHVIIASAHTTNSGNNGTVKIQDGASEDEPIINNEPHVCSFHVDFFYADPTQTGDWSIQSWEPTGDKSTVLNGSYDTTSTGEYKTPVYSLADGHYQLNWEGRNDHNTKHKTFWVDCGNTQTPTPTETVTETPSVAPTETITPEATPTCTPTPTDTVENYDTPTPTPGNGGDYITETPTPTEESQNSTDTVTPTPTTDSVSATATETPTPGVGGQSNTQGTSTSSTSNEASILSTGASTSSAALLGTSTMANTGSLTQNLMQFILMIGVALLMSSLLLYAQERKN